LCTHIHAKDVICRLIRKGYTGAYSIEHHSGELEVERTHWQLASLREIMAEIALEGVDTKDAAVCWGEKTLKKYSKSAPASPEAPLL